MRHRGACSKVCVPTASRVPAVCLRRNSSCWRYRQISWDEGEAVERSAIYLASGKRADTLFTAYYDSGFGNRRLAPGGRRGPVKSEEPCPECSFVGDYLCYVLEFPCASLHSFYQPGYKAEHATEGKGWPALVLSPVFFVASSALARQHLHGGRPTVFCLERCKLLILGSRAL